MALGQKDAKPLRTPLGLPGISDAVVWVLPWPKGAPTAPEFLPGTGMTTPTDFERDKAALVDVLRQFSEREVTSSFSPSPVFGRLSRRAWGRLMWRHLDYHLHQFGV